MKSNLKRMLRIIHSICKNETTLSIGIVDFDSFSTQHSNDVVRLAETWGQSVSSLEHYERFETYASSLLGKISDVVLHNRQAEVQLLLKS